MGPGKSRGLVGHLLGDHSTPLAPTTGWAPAEPRTDPQHPHPGRLHRGPSSKHSRGPDSRENSKEAGSPASMVTLYPRFRPQERAPRKEHTGSAGTYCLHLLHLQQWQFWGTISQGLGAGRGRRGLLQGPLLPSDPLKDNAGVLHGLMQQVLSTVLARTGKLLRAWGLQGRWRNGGWQSNSVYDTHLYSLQTQGTRGPQCTPSIFTQECPWELHSSLHLSSFAPPCLSLPSGSHWSLIFSGTRPHLLCHQTEHWESRPKSVLFPLKPMPRIQRTSTPPALTSGARVFMPKGSSCIWTWTSWMTVPLASVTR